MPKIALWALIGSIVLLFPIFVFNGSFQPLYYVLWVIGVGGYVYRNHVALEEKFRGWNIGSFKKFMMLGIVVILIEETFASTSMHLMEYLKAGSFVGYFRDVSQFWALNLLALPGMIMAWYFLLRRYAYTKKEIFILAGLFGLFSEKIYTHVLAYPLFAWLLIVPTMFTYGVIISIPALSIDHTQGKQSHFLIRYTLGLVVPFLFSIPFIGILSYLFVQYPGAFPPFGFFQ